MPLLRRTWTMHLLDTLPTEQLRKEAHQTYRVRHHGNKKLPLPPLLDPIVHEARTKYTIAEHQRQRDVPLTDFQKELVGNPHAAALCTPVRLCRHLGVRLPSHFLQCIAAEFDENATEHKFRFVPYDKINPLLEPDTANQPLHKDSVRHKLYYASSAASIRQLTKGSAWRNALSQPLQVGAAAILSRSVRSLQPKDVFVWDSEMDTKIELVLLRKVRTNLVKLWADHSDLFLPEEQAVAQLSDIALFVRVNAETSSLDTLHGKPCYSLARFASSEKPRAATKSGTEIMGLLGRPESMAFMLSLDRLFTYNGLDT